MRSIPFAARPLVPAGREPQRPKAETDREWMRGYLQRRSGGSQTDGLDGTMTRWMERAEGAAMADYLAQPQIAEDVAARFEAAYWTQRAETLALIWRARSRARGTGRVVSPEISRSASLASPRSTGPDAQCTGPDCPVCTAGRGQTADYGRYLPPRPCSGCGYISCRCGVAGAYVQPPRYR